MFAQFGLSLVARSMKQLCMTDNFKPTDILNLTYNLPAWPENIGPAESPSLISWNYELEI